MIFPQGITSKSVRLKLMTGNVDVDIGTDAIWRIVQTVEGNQMSEKKPFFINEELGLTNKPKIKFIVCAAILMKDGTIVPGVRHFSPEMRIILHKMYGDNYHLHVLEQGFINQVGEFLNRNEAWKLADINGQIRKLTGWEDGSKPRPSGIGDEGLLFSENLY